jgi:hypothetical protein
LPVLARAYTSIRGKSDSAQKDEPAPLDEESFKALTTRIQGRAFRRDKGMWIDQTYRDSVQRWRIRKLTRGTKEYDQILSANPGLKEFFDRAPILIVWKDGWIYKVQ